MSTMFRIVTAQHGLPVRTSPHGDAPLHAENVTHGPLPLGARVKITGQRLGDFVEVDTGGEGPGWVLACFLEPEPETDERAVLVPDPAPTEPAPSPATAPAPSVPSLDVPS